MEQTKEDTLADVQKEIQEVRDHQNEVVQAVSSGIECIMEMGKGKWIFWQLVTSIQKELKTSLSILRREETNQKKMMTTMKRTIQEESEKLKETITEKIERMQSTENSAVVAVSTVPRVSRRRRLKSSDSENSSGKVARLQPMDTNLFSAVPQQSIKKDLFIIDDFLSIYLGSFMIIIFE